MNDTGSDAEAVTAKALHLQMTVLDIFVRHGWLIAMMPGRNDGTRAHLKMSSESCDIVCELWPRLTYPFKLRAPSANVLGAFQKLLGPIDERSQPAGFPAFSIEKLTDADSVEGFEDLLEFFSKH